MSEPTPPAGPPKDSAVPGCLLVGCLIGLVLLLIGISICGQGLHISH